jgi:hypothetical protein
MIAVTMVLYKGPRRSVIIRGYRIGSIRQLRLDDDEAVENVIVPRKEFEVGRVMLNLADSFGQNGGRVECHWLATAG